MKIRYDMTTCYIVRPDAAGTSHEFLQLLRAKEDFMGGTWQAVSGGMEPNEAAWRAALREMKEETGLAPLEFYRLPVVNIFYISEHDTLWHSIGFCAIVRREDPVVLNEEHEAFRWIPRTKVDQEFMWATDRSAIAELCHAILDGGTVKPYLHIPIK